MDLPDAVRKSLPLLTIVIVIGMAYDGWIFYGRWKVNHGAEEQRAKQDADRARRTVDALGGESLKILTFYATPPVIREGGHSTICFGANGAKHVRIQPPVEELHPALSYCFNVSPRENTKYDLTVEDAAGHSATQSIEIRVTR